MDIFIQENGDLQFIYDDALADVFDDGETHRASHVEPAAGGWTADLSPVGGPVLGPYLMRREALDAEVTWLRDRMMSGRVVVHTQPIQKGQQ